MDENERGAEILPGLPKDLSMLCLARVPRGELENFGVVSKAWRDALRSSEICVVRRSLGMFEDWPLVLLQGAGVTARLWLTLDPIFGLWYRLPAYEADEEYHSADKECFVAGKYLLVVGIQTRLLPRAPDRIEAIQLIRCFNTEDGVWSYAPPMSVMRCLFASASTGIYGYVAGGTIYGTGGRASKSVQRFNSQSGSWEDLPDMSYERKECSGFIMNERFYVIGGSDGRGRHYSHGEYYEPRTDAWTTVDDLWSVLSPARSAPPLVAVIENDLYALDAAANSVKHYSQATGVWTFVTTVPGRGRGQSGWGQAFKAVGGELWVVGGRSPQERPVGDIQAFKPDPIHGLHSPWRLVANTVNGDGFCLNCAIVKM